MHFVRVDPMFQMRMRKVTDWHSPSAMSSLTRINRVGPRVFERLANVLREIDEEALASLA
jgi:hypothetical protein